MRLRAGGVHAVRALRAKLKGVPHSTETAGRTSRTLADLTATALDGRYEDGDGDGRRDEPLPRSLIAALQAEQITGYLVGPGAEAPPGVSQEVLLRALRGESVSSEGRTRGEMVLVEARPLADGTAVILEQPFTVVGVEAGGHGLDSGQHAASLAGGRPGVLHGNRTYLLQDENGQVIETHSISAGLDYPGVGPEHAWLKDSSRAEYVTITDAEALAAFHYLCRTEGIIPALESSHAVAYAMKLAKTMRPDQSILVNLSGRGDKDIGTVADLSNADFFCRPSCTGQTVKGGDLSNLGKVEHIVRMPT